MEQTQAGSGPGGGEASGHGPVTAEMVRQLRATRPWVLFMAVLGFVGCGFMVLSGLGMMAFGSLIPEFGGGMALLVGLVYLGGGAIYVFLSLYLWRFATAIQRIQGATDGRAIEQALGHQCGFWRFLGILTIVSTVLSVVLVVAAVLVGLMTTGLR